MHRHDPGLGQEPYNASRRHHVHGRRAARHSRSSRTGMVVAIAAIVLFAAWAGAASLYIVFRDDALRLLAERQITVTRAYDAQIVELQAELVRLRSLKLVEQERVDRTLSELGKRQSELENRQAALSALTAQRAGEQHADDNAAPRTTGSLPSPNLLQHAPAAAKPSPLSNRILLTPRTQEWAQLESRPLPPLPPHIETSAVETATDVRIANLARRQRETELAQSETLNAIEEFHDGSAQRLKKVFADLGIQPPRHPARRIAARSGSEDATGGPFLPWTRASQDPFALQLQRIHRARTSAEALKEELATVPVRRPIAGDSEVTSNFGMRTDPFLGQLAMHTGVDFRAETGDRVYAAAGGTVAFAGRNGGYGIMVDIDHGNGIVTRYAHLSATQVREGARVVTGEPIGRAGSTGRSTGPHLHYEVRIDGEAVDPQKFLRAGLRLEQPH